MTFYALDVRPLSALLDRSPNFFRSCKKVLNAEGALYLFPFYNALWDVNFVIPLIHDVNSSQLSGASHRSSEDEALLDARRDTVTHRATSNTPSFSAVRK